MTTGDKAELLPCPCCHSIEVQPEHDPHCFSGQKYPGYSTDDGYRCYCTKCGMQTCWWHTEAEMLKCWNTRAPSPPSEVVTQIAMILRQHCYECDGLGWHGIARKVLEAAGVSGVPEERVPKLTPLHLKLLRRGTQGAFIGLSNDMAVRLMEMGALRDLHRLGLAAYSGLPRPDGPPGPRPSVTTDAGRDFIQAAAAPER